MKNIFKRKQQEETEMKTNKFAGKRQYKLRIGLPEKTLTKLTDLYELLQCEPDKDGYVVTTFKEIQELTEMDLVLVSIMTANGMIRKATTGGSPKFKYKWDTIKPTMDMAVKLLEKRIENNKDAPEGVVSESKPESLLPAPAETEVDNQEIIDKKDISVHSEPDEFDSSVIVDCHVDTNGILTMHVNLPKLGIKESDVINAVLAISSNK